MRSPAAGASAPRHSSRRWPTHTAPRPASTLPAPLGPARLALLYGPTPVPDAIARVEELLLEAGSDPCAARATVSASLAGLLAMQGEARPRAAPLRRRGRHLRGARAAAAPRATRGYRLADRAPRRRSCCRRERAPDGERRPRRLRRARRSRRVQRRLLADVLARSCVLRRGGGDRTRGSRSSLPEDDLAPQVLWRTALGRVLAARGDLAEAERLSSRHSPSPKPSSSPTSASPHSQPRPRSHGTGSRRRGAEASRGGAGDHGGEGQPRRAPVARSAIG